MTDNGTYPNHPRVAVGAVVVRHRQVLLVRRRKAPARGLWAIPGGRVRLGESLRQAAEREILEETGLTIRAGEPVLTFESIHRDDGGRVRFHYVIVDLAAEYVAGEIRPADDASDARWFSRDEIMSQADVVPETRELVRRLFSDSM
ncbi:MAG: NUDIX hydrolase [Deltaproteobacteria bacterium]|nr:NUDIX hydrolase [Deltaproteobacteria bacterium]